MFNTIRKNAKGGKEKKNDGKNIPSDLFGLNEIYVNKTFKALHDLLFVFSCPTIALARST